eukprot:g2349.t1
MERQRPFERSLDVVRLGSSSENPASKTCENWFQHESWMRNGDLLSREFHDQSHRRRQEQEMWQLRLGLQSAEPKRPEEHLEEEEEEEEEGEEEEGAEEEGNSNSIDNLDENELESIVFVSEETTVEADVTREKKVDNKIPRYRRRVDVSPVDVTRNLRRSHRRMIDANSPLSGWSEVGDVVETYNNWDELPCVGVVGFETYKAVPKAPEVEVQQPAAELELDKKKDKQNDDAKKKKIAKHRRRRSLFSKNKKSTESPSTSVNEKKSNKKTEEASHSPSSILRSISISGDETGDFTIGAGIGLGGVRLSAQKRWISKTGAQRDFVCLSENLYAVRRRSQTARRPNNKDKFYNRTGVKKVTSEKSEQPRPQSAAAVQSIAKDRERKQRRQAYAIMKAQAQKRAEMKAEEDAKRIVRKRTIPERQTTRRPPFQGFGGAAAAKKRQNQKWHNL